MFTDDTKLCGAVHSPVWEAGEIDVLRPFECTWREEGGFWTFLGEAVPLSTSPTSRAWPGTGANHWHIGGNAPLLSLEPLTQLLIGQITGNPTWGTGPWRPRGIWGWTRQKCMCWPFFFWGSLLAEHPRPPELVSVCVLFYISFLSFFLLIISSQNFCET